LLFARLTHQVPATHSHRPCRRNPDEADDNAEFRMNAPKALVAVRHMPMARLEYFFILRLPLRWQSRSVRSLKG
jgi:hypothetical protein